MVHGDTMDKASHSMNHRTRLRGDVDSAVKAFWQHERSRGEGTISVPGKEAPSAEKGQQEPSGTPFSSLLGPTGGDARKRTGDKQDRTLHRSASTSPAMRKQEKRQGESSDAKGSGKDESGKSKGQVGRQKSSPHRSVKRNGGDTASSSSSSSKRESKLASESNSRPAPPPEKIWLRGTKESSYEVQIVHAKSLRQLKQVFLDIDTGGTGEVTFDEFVDHLQSRNPSALPNAMDIFNHMDATTTHRVTFRTLLMALFPGARKEQVDEMEEMASGEAKSKGASRQQVEEAERLFHLLDGDQDGLLNFKEFYTGLRSYYLESEADKEFRRLDKKQQNGIDKDDFVEWFLLIESLM